MNKDERNTMNNWILEFLSKNIQTSLTEAMQAAYKEGQRKAYDKVYDMIEYEVCDLCEFKQADCRKTCDADDMRQAIQCIVKDFKEAVK